jgi:hypothetical protein
VAAQDAETPSTVAARGNPGRNARSGGAMALSFTAMDAERGVGGEDSLTVPHTVGVPPSETVLVADAANTAITMKPPRRRGRPRKASQGETAFVEWWKPGWREKLQ